MPLTSYGLREWLTITLVSLLLALGAWWLGWWWAIVAVGVVWLALASFFRDPPFRRPATAAPTDLVSPADGTVSAVFTAPEHAATDGRPALVIRIFLSVLNVHVNRSPCDCEVLGLTHTPGKYLDARSEESALVNESNLIRLRGADGMVFGVRQVSGAIARRIVCPLKVGDRLARGERFGMIKFGSTTELILPWPDRMEALVRKGDRVTGGVTILARPRT